MVDPSWVWVRLPAPASVAVARSGIVNAASIAAIVGMCCGCGCWVPWPPSGTARRCRCRVRAAAAGLPRAAPGFARPRRAGCPVLARGATAGSAGKPADCGVGAAALAAAGEDRLALEQCRGELLADLDED
ncbi:MAG: hypothetical protein ACRDRG_21520, partial [Pseudonocardiaceae bacterium]